jgi:general secretion pathway protein G
MENCGNFYVNNNRARMRINTGVFPLFRTMNYDNRGFTLVELIVVVALLAILVAMALPTYSWIVDRTKEKSCMADLRTLQKDINAYIIEKNELPDDLDKIGRANLLDPWGRPFRYFKISRADQTRYTGDTIAILLNNEYDLYSTGKDGLSTQSLADSDSQDDIISAGDGTFVGMGSAYY